jgi:hypothetical protein
MFSGHVVSFGHRGLHVGVIAGAIGIHSAWVADFGADSSVHAVAADWICHRQVDSP